MDSQDRKYRAVSEERPDTPPAPSKNWMPPPSTAIDDYQEMISQPTEEELAEQKRKDDQARILAELPPLAVGYIGAKWEIEVGFPYPLHDHRN